MDTLNAAITAWTLILGFLTPLAISLINRPQWTSTVRKIIAVAIAVAIAVVNLLVQGKFAGLHLNLETVFTILSMVVGASQAAYALVWHPTGVAAKVDSLTNDSSPRHAAVE